MGTIQEAGKKTLDVGVRESGEAAELGAALRRGELELKEEWQDEEFPRVHPLLSLSHTRNSSPLGPPTHTSILVLFFLLSPTAGTPLTLALCGQRPMRKRLSAPELRLSLTKGPGNDGASPTQSAPSSPDGSSDLEVDELETPSDSEQLDSGHEFEWEGGKQTRGPRAGRSRGYLAIYFLFHTSIVFFSAFVTDLRVFSVAQAAVQLRKNLRALVVVHATWYVKAFLALLRPFISSKFTRKIRFLDSLEELAQLISLDQVHIPEAVRQLDQDLHGSGGT
ncbi:bcl-2/adenovirus E1B 19 kDa-interacting protein 2-like protein [Cebus imitator]|uniref:bcl-2/adenovirus E1B 19 kDa-interacting protein 2-like protein n=1 Tax=Cebus imitator TaxID=2715852 RepID=UPI00189828CE|nr:bcl-2/adenovirus E1B 19 kDa-interacting protein 2-like protein [Cebus imitator]